MEINGGLNYVSREREKENYLVTTLVSWGCHNKFPHSYLMETSFRGSRGWKPEIKVLPGTYPQKDPGEDLASSGF